MSFPSSSPLDSLLERFAPPPWLVRDLQQRAVLFLNHVLQQESAAQARLLRQQGRVARVEWRAFSIDLIATPAGLLDLAPAAAKPDLTLALAETSPLAIARDLAGGERPKVTISGDVQLAAEVGWLIEHVRWDAEEDLARLIGDAPAHALAEGARRVAEGLRDLLARRRGPGSDGGARPDTASGTHSGAA